MQPLRSISYSLQSMINVVNFRLAQCPYDGALLDVEINPGGLLSLVCVCCDAAWETHGSYVGRKPEKSDGRRGTHARELRVWRAPGT